MTTSADNHTASGGVVDLSSLDDQIAHAVARAAASMQLSSWNSNNTNSTMNTHHKTVAK